MINVCPMPLGQRAAVGGEVQDRTGPGPSAGGTRPCPQKPQRRPGFGEWGTKLSWWPQGRDTRWGDQAEVALIFLFQMGTTTRNFLGLWITPSWWPTPSGCLSGTQGLSLHSPVCTSLVKLLSLGWDHANRKTARNPLRIWALARCDDAHCWCHQQCCALPSLFAVAFLGSASPCVITCRGEWC